MPNDSKHISYSFLTIPTNTVYVIVLTWSDLQIWHFASRASVRDNKEIDVSLIHPELIKKQRIKAGAVVVCKINVTRTFE